MKRSFTTVLDLLYLRPVLGKGDRGFLKTRYILLTVILGFLLFGGWQGNNALQTLLK